MNEWLCYKLSASKELADWEWQELSVVFFENGADGTEIVEDYLLVYFKQDQLPANISKLIEAHSLKIVSTEQIENQNWSAFCEELFEPVKIGTLSVLPTTDYTEKTSQANELNLIPGMGFGSGHHPTTGMLIALMQSLELPAAAKILDFGTGSGILSIAAAKLFPESQILAIDNDPQALLNAEDNLKINSNYQQQIKFSSQDVNEINSTYNLILANIYLEVLKSHKSKLVELLKPDAKLLLSGITNEQAEELEDKFKSDFRIIKKTEQDGWNAYLFER